VTPEVAESIGRAFATLVRRRLENEEPGAGAGARQPPEQQRAGRRRPPRDGGRRRAVIDVGLVPTPAHSFAMSHWGADGGLQVTGSHNPPQYNGFKMTISGGSIYGD
jgi:hypothetical protein